MCPLYWTTSKEGILYSKSPSFTEVEMLKAIDKNLIDHYNFADRK